jgi:hypothetical protein
LSHRLAPGMFVSSGVVIVVFALALAASSPGAAD